MITPEEFRDGAADDFANRAPIKFDQGRNEHGGGSILDCPNLIGAIEEEIVDSWHYVKAVRVKIQEAIAHLDNLDGTKAREFLRKLIDAVR